MTIIRTGMIPVMVLLLLVFAAPSGADELSAIQVFDGMIHYEYDQLNTNASINDFRCHLTETTVRTGVTAREIVDKVLYFMCPTVQLQMIDQTPVFYFDDELLMVLLESVELERLGDAEVDEIECYVIQSTPMDPAFDRYSRKYYVAKDDFRKVMTVANHATREFDDLTTEIYYYYETVNGFQLLSSTVAETMDSNENILATVTTTYTDYEFGLGLEMSFFNNILDESDVNTPLN